MTTSAINNSCVPGIIPDTQNEIISFLDINSLLSARLVNKKWNKTATAILWKKISIKSENEFAQAIRDFCQKLAADEYYILLVKNTLQKEDPIIQIGIGNPNEPKKMGSKTLFLSKEFKMENPKLKSKIQLKGNQAGEMNLGTKGGGRITKFYSFNESPKLLDDRQMLLYANYTYPPALRPANDIEIENILIETINRLVDENVQRINTKRVILNVIAAISIFTLGYFSKNLELYRT